MEILFSIVTLIGMGYAVFVGVKWMLKAGQLSQKREQPLAPTDLKVLEESAARLMSDLRATADECVSRVELAIAQAESRMRAIEQPSVPRVSRRESLDPTSPIEVPASPALQNSYETAESTGSAARVARQSGMTTGEVELLRGLRRMGTR